MKRLYWKILLIEGVFLSLIFGVIMWGMGISHDAYKNRRQEERVATMELLRMALQNDLPDELSLPGLEKVVSKLVKGDVCIVESDRTESTSDQETIPFRKGGTAYTLVVPLPNEHKGLSDVIPFLLHDKYGTVLFLLALALGLLAIPVARVVTRPLQVLRQDMRRFASGDLSHRTRVKSKDEVGEVAKDFNEMARSIQSLVNVGKEMTAHVSHELRSPLTRIDVARQVLEEQLTGKPLALLDSIREEIEDMDTLIDKILRLSRLELDITAPAPLCFVEIIDEALRRHAASFEAHGIDLHRDLPDKAPGVGVKEDIACLIDNLLNNALKFTPQGGGIDVSLARDDDGTAITVTNDAQKPAVDPMRLTEPFQRGGASESTPGSGLGLAIAKRIVENHGGDMSLSWADGKFSVVVLLPGGDKE